MNNKLEKTYNSVRNYYQMKDGIVSLEGEKPYDTNDDNLD